MSYRIQKRWISYPAILLTLLVLSTARAEGPDPRAAERGEMVKEQIQSRGIKDTAVLKAMEEVPRHLFVPPEHRAEAYADKALPIGENQTISQPYIVAFMTQALRLGDKKDKNVLEIGTGSGYQAAVLGRLSLHVATIEIVPQLAKRAKILLAALSVANVEAKTGDGYVGWPEKAPFDAIMVTASAGEIPQPLIDQLAPGGRLVMPVGGKSDQSLVLLTKTEKGITRETLIPVLFVPMTGRAKEGK